MAKSTLESLEKLLVKYVGPIEQKCNCLIREVKILQGKVDKYEAILYSKQKNDEGSCQSATNAAHKSHNPQTAKTSSDRTHTSTPPLVQPAPERQRRVFTRERQERGIATPPSTEAPAVTTPRRWPPAHGPITTATTDTDAHAHAQPTAPLPTKACNNKLDNTNESPATADTINDSWQTVTNRRRRPTQLKRTVIKGSGSIDSDLQTVERVRKIHACFFKPETTPEMILAYMNKKSMCAEYHVEKLKLTHNYYSSFTVTVPNSQFELFMSAENWPARTEISEWFRRSNRRAGGAPRRNPGRRTSGAEPGGATPATSTDRKPSATRQ